MQDLTFIAAPDELILVTGANGFIGSRVVEGLLERGHRKIRCFVRPPGASKRLAALAEKWREKAFLEVYTGNLLSRSDCASATKEVRIVYHLAAGRADMIADAFMNSVVSTRHLLGAF